MTKSQYFISFIFALVFSSCAEDSSVRNQSQGGLFIIGGGHRPPSLIQDLISFANLKEDEYAIVLPMASSEPDTAAYYAIKQFHDQGFNRISSLNFKEKDNPDEWKNLLSDAKLIYITGGDQSRFMQIAQACNIDSIIKNTWFNGAIIAGTSAGAAVMSAKMITGNEYLKEEYTGEFNTIEANNIEIKQGLGLLSDGIVDQHFIQRMRMNRLITVALEHPDDTAWGIDESTALVVWGDSARIAGEGQVIMLRNPYSSYRVKDGLLAGRNLDLTVWVNGDTFKRP